MKLWNRMYDVISQLDVVLVPRLLASRYEASHPTFHTHLNLAMILQYYRVREFIC